MCYHYSNTADKVTLEERYTVEHHKVYEDQYEVIYHNDGFAHNKMPVITAMNLIKYSCTNGDLSGIGLSTI